MRRSKLNAAVAWAFLLPAVLLAQNEARSKALARIEAERSTWINGKVLWSRVLNGNQEGRTYFESRHSSGDLITTMLGDEVGPIALRPDGTPGISGTGPFSSLVRDGEWWRYMEGAVIADCDERLQPQRGGINARTLGLSASKPLGDLNHTLWGDGTIAWEFTEKRAGEWIIVRAESGTAVREWTLDPQRGGLPVRVSSFQDGRRTRDSRITLAKFDVGWYPHSIEYFRGDSDDGQPPEEVIEVSDVVLNTNELPKGGFTPEDIGIENGVMVIRRDTQRVAAAPFLKWADGELLSLDDYDAALDSGRIVESERFRANYARAAAIGELRRTIEAAKTSKDGSASTIMRDRMSEWEKYTIRSVDRYRLDGDQTQKAILQLDAAKSEAQKFYTKNKARLDAMDIELLSLQSLSGADLTKRIQQWSAKREQLLAPLDDIFERSLKPDLDRLPTVAQRKALESRSATTQPASRPATSAPVSIPTDKK